MTIINFKNNISRVLIIILIFLPFFIFPIGKYYDYFYAPKAQLLSILSIILIIIYLKNHHKSNGLIYVDIVNKLLITYFVFLIISVFLAENTLLAINGRPYRVDGLSTILTYFILFLSARTTKFDDKKLVNYLVFAATFLSVYGIMQYFGLDPIPRDFKRVNWKASFATFGNPNFFGTYLVLMIPFSLHLFFKYRVKFGLICYSILLFALLCTRTRGAWIGAFISIGIYLYITWINEATFTKYMKRVMLVIIISIITVISFNIVSDNVFIKEFFSMTKDASMIIEGGEEAETAGSFRFFIWKRVIEMIKERPLFGYGIENLAEPFDRMFKQEIIDIIGRPITFDKAHNEYLHIAVTSGIPSLIIYLAFIFQILKDGIRKISISSYYWPVIAAVVGYLAQAFFNISVVAVAYIFWIFLGILSSYKDISKEDNQIVLH